MHANIYEIKSLNDILKYCIKDSLVIFDIDNTLIKPANEAALGSDQWFSALLAYSLKLITEPMEAKQLAITIRNAVYRIIQMEKVEPVIAKIIKKLRQNNIPYIALTARGPSIITTTQKQLQDLDIGFTQHALREDCLDVPDFKFEKGIIYCGGKDKGLALTYYFNKFKFVANNIIMVDDSIKNLISVSNVLLNQEISFNGLRYNFLDSYIAQFDMKKAVLQLSKVKHLMSDDEQSIIRRLNLSGGLI